MKILDSTNLKLLFYCLFLILFLKSWVDGMPLFGSRNPRRRSSVTPTASNEPAPNTDTANTGAAVIGNIPLPDQIHITEDDEDFIDYNFDIQHGNSPNTNHRGDRGAVVNDDIPLDDRIHITADGENFIDYNFGIQHRDIPNTNRRHKIPKDFQPYVPYRDEASRNLFEHRRNFKQTREEEDVEAPTPFSNSDGSETEENQSGFNSPDHNSDYGDNKEPALYHDVEFHHTGGSGYYNHEAGSSSNTFGSGDHDHNDYGIEGSELVYNFQNMHNALPIYPNHNVNYEHNASDLRQGGGIQHSTRANYPGIHGHILNPPRTQHNRVKKQRRHNH